MAFETRRLGGTSAEVTVMGLGTATLAGNMELVAESEAKMIVIDGFDSGIRYFDTAPFYGYGKSEHFVGDELRNRNGWVLSTKVGRRLKPRHTPQEPDDAWQRPLDFESYFDFSYDGVMRAYEDSLQRLGLNHVDILYMHDVDVFTTQPEKYAECVASTYRALDELRRNGEVKAIGMGVNNAKPIADALDLGQWDCFLLAGRYTLLEQGPLKTLLPAIAKHGASVVVGGPFNSGVLAGRDTWNYTRAPEGVMTRVKALARVCDAHHVPLAAAALHFPLAHPTIASVIPGPRSTAELNQIFEWWNHKIPASLWSDLKNEKLIEADAPVPS